MTSGLGVLGLGGEELGELASDMVYVLRDRQLALS
jgi:hypothetical protein